MSPCVAFTGGGTGGHIYPGLAVADQLRTLCRERGLDGLSVMWIGSSSGVDRRLVEAAGSADVFFGIPSGKLRRYLSFRNVVDVFRIAAGFFAALFILLKNRPAVLFSKGGFVSVPPCFAARVLGIPVYTHECDFSPGLATRLNSRVASKILLSYKETAGFFGAGEGGRLTVTGNPVRPAFYTASAERGRKFLGLDGAGDKPVLVVIGGSLGARQINALVTQSLDFLCRNFVVVHQTGAGNEGSAAAAVPAGSYKPYGFIYSEMPDVLAAADVVLSRAGANSLWECAVLGKPMVLVPLCGPGTRGDQVENARFFAERGAACVLSEGEADASHLEDALRGLLDRSVRKRFACAASALASGTPPARLVSELLYSEVASR